MERAAGYNTMLTLSLANRFALLWVGAAKFVLPCAGAMLIFVHTGASLCRGHAYLRCYLTGAMLTWIERSWSSLFQETLQAILSTFCSSNALLLKYEATPVNLRSVLTLERSIFEDEGIGRIGCHIESVSVSVASSACHNDHVM